MLRSYFLQIFLDLLLPIENVVQHINYDHLYISEGCYYHCIHAIAKLSLPISIFLSYLLMLVTIWYISKAGIYGNCFNTVKIFFFNHNRCIMIARVLNNLSTRLRVYDNKQTTSLLVAKNGNAKLLST